MKSLSISFTLGKQGSSNKTNINHNNREYIAKNISISKVNNNINYKQELPEKAYEKLFSESLQQYNAKQKKPCRRINNYYTHVLNSKREEAFYEAIIQYGDSQTASCKSQTGKETKNMLDEYMKNFQNRNPNLYVFNATLHLDEASPHLHIDFIPFYTEGRIKGLSKGVSLKAALDEQGFTAKNKSENQLVVWEENERNELERILNKYGYVKEDKNAKHQHMTVTDYKNYKEEESIITAISRIKRNDSILNNNDSITKLKEKLKSVEFENSQLTKVNSSEYKSLYYSSPDKQSFVQSELEKRKINYIETETGFEIQSYYLDVVREIEKEYKPVRSPLRDRLRNDIDRLILSSGNLDELLKKLEENKYTIKKGKYISVLPDQAEKYIRLKSLGEYYSELALKNRIAANQKFENDITIKLKNTSEENLLQQMTIKSITVYTIAVKRGLLPLKKRNIRKPFTWTNDPELDKLSALNAKINSGATLESIKSDFEQSENKYNDLLSKVENKKNDLKYFRDLKEHIDIVFEGKSKELSKIMESKKILSSFTDFKITKDNYKNINSLIENEVSDLEILNTELSRSQAELKRNADYFEFAQKVAGGTYVQSMVQNEKIRSMSEYVPHGTMIV